MDFSLIMFIALAVTGGLWAADRLLLARHRADAARALERDGKNAEAVSKARKESVIVEYARAFFPVILVVFLLRSFLVEPFRIPSGSMLPSLLIGDFILVNKYAYGIRLPVINKKIIALDSPKRGDVAVFRFPRDMSTNYIKRVVGLPGDHVAYRDKKLYVNGKLMEQSGGAPYYLNELGIRRMEAQRLTENLDGTPHDILKTSREDPGVLEFDVPEGQYFVMGDNRDQSNDSRYWGYVPDANLVGKAFLVWFSWDMNGTSGGFWDRIIWNRIGDTIH